MISEYFGGVVSETVDKFEPDQLPVLMIIVKARSGLEVFSVLQGHISADELMGNLLTSVDSFQHMKELDMRDEVRLILMLPVCCLLCLVFLSFIDSTMCRLCVPSLRVEYRGNLVLCKR